MFDRKIIISFAKKLIQSSNYSTRERACQYKKVYGISNVLYQKHINNRYNK